MSPVRIGILSFRSEAHAREQWQATAEYLSVALDGRPVIVLPMGFEALEQAVAAKQLEFVLTNTAHYIELEAAHGVTRLATLVQSVQGNPLREFGGVIFTRADRGDIHGLTDLRDRSLLAVDRSSLGGFLVAWQALLRAGVDPFRDIAHLGFAGMPHDTVVRQVLSGDADAGAVRTGVLEEMAGEGKIKLADLRVLNRQSDPDFPFLLSTALYPEWPFSRMPDTPEALVKQVSVALLSMPSGHPAAVAGGYVNWSAPLDYSAAHQLMRELRVGPYAGSGHLDPGQWIRQHLGHVAGVLATALLGAILLVGKFGAMNRRLRHEVTERRVAEAALRDNEARLSHLAHHDPLTGLSNRLLFHDRLEQALSRLDRNQGLLAVMFIDLDRFKNINDSLGHDVGDDLLNEVARRLTLTLRGCDTISRLGGDEFVVVVEDVRDATQALEIGKKIVDTLRQPTFAQGHRLEITASLGIALAPRDGQDVRTLMRCADTALYSVKERGRDGVRLYSRDMNPRALDLLLLEGDLRRAIRNDQLDLHYQPKFDLATGQAAGVEALARWRHPHRGWVSPEEFIRLAEETGLIATLGENLLHRACRQGRRWQDQGFPGVPVAVNLSSRQFRQDDLVEVIRAVLRETGLHPEQLELEITETTAMEQVQSAVSIMEELRAVGVDLSIDDFGTGYSSLSYLQCFPVGKLKIDRSFIAEIQDADSPGAIPRAVIALAHSLGLKVVAEGVETRGQAAFLQRHRCDQVQGFLYRRPLPPAELERGIQPDNRLIALAGAG